MINFQYVARHRRRRRGAPDRRRSGGEIHRRRHQPDRPDEGGCRTPVAADRHFAPAAQDGRGNGGRRLAHRRAGAEFRPRLSPADRATLSAARERDPRRRLAAAAQHGVDRRQSSAAHALLSTSTTRRRPATSASPAAAAPPSTGSTACTRSSARAKPASRPIRPTCAWRLRRSTPRFMSRGPAGERAIAFADFHRLPGDDAAARHQSAAGRDRHRGRAAGAGLCRELHLSEDPRPPLLCLRAGLGRGRAGARRRHASRRRGWRSAASRTSRGATRTPKRRCAARPPTRATFARAADIVLRDAKGFAHNAFKIELARRAIVRALTQAARGTPQSQSNKKIG